MLHVQSVQYMACEVVNVFIFAKMSKTLILVPIRHFASEPTTLVITFSSEIRTKLHLLKVINKPDFVEKKPIFDLQRFHVRFFRFHRNSCSIFPISQKSLFNFSDFKEIPVLQKSLFDFVEIPVQFCRDSCSILGLPSDFIDMVNSFAIDPMHAVYQNCVRRTIDSWTTRKQQGPLSKEGISYTAFLHAGESWSKVKLPREFNRQPRGFEHFKNFKATELRTLLLYGGERILRKCMRGQSFNTWVLLVTGIRILSCPELCLVRFFRFHRNSCSIS